MSDEAGSAAVVPNEIQPTPRPAGDPAEPLVDFVRAQPVTAALAALFVGYLLGRIS